MSTSTDSNAPDITPRYPSIKTYIDPRTSPIGILARVRVLLRKHGVSKMEVREFHTEAIASDGDKDHLLRTVKRWITVI